MGFIHNSCPKGLINFLSKHLLVYHAKVLRSKRYLIFLLNVRLGSVNKTSLITFYIISFSDSDY